MGEGNPSSTFTRRNAEILKNQWFGEGSEGKKHGYGVVYTRARGATQKRKGSATHKSEVVSSTSEKNKTTSEVNETTSFVKKQMSGCSV